MKLGKLKLVKLFNAIINILFYGCVGLVLFILIQVFCFTSFCIPSDSMEPSLRNGDNILVNKIHYGARLFDLKAAFAYKEFDIKRMPSFGSFNRNDILVFNFPYPVRWDSISFDLTKYYVKRCVALPGDTIQIRKGFFLNSNHNGYLGNSESQKHIASLNNRLLGSIQYETFPWNSQMNWNIKEFGPIPVPAKGQLINLDSGAFILYHQLIGWEQQKKIQMSGEEISLGDSIIYSYKFTHNYYFVVGDKLDNSQDSRYWGLLPEDYIVGKAVMIWNSKDPHTGKIRWNRIGKKIK